MKKFGLLSLTAATALMASGYTVPEQSQKAIALSSAYVANAHGADASYYNPANMAFDKGNGSFEADLTYIHLTSVKFDGTVGGGPVSSTSSEKENFLVPTFYYVSPSVDDFHFGLALTSPAGLSKRWKDQPGKTFSEEFTLRTYEVNPTVAYKVNEQLAIGVGLRMIYSDGIVKSTAPASLATMKRDMNGDGLDFGYNLALTYKPLKELSLAATYRSYIDLELEGDATLSNDIGGSYSGPVSVSAPTPATFNLAAAYTFDEKTTVELVYERTYWSKYRQLDFEYSGDKTNFATFVSVFDDPIDKSWKDTDSYRLGMTHKYDSAWTVMAGLVRFETPVPERTLNFELPDSNGWAYSLGGRYAMSEKVQIGASFLYADREKRSVSNNDNGISGTFSNSKAYLLSLGIEYKF